MRHVLPLLLSCLLVFALAGCGQPSAVSSAAAPTYQEQYDLGVKYLSEGNYQEAVAAFTAAIEIEANHAEAYTGRGDGYVGLAKGDGAKAQEKYRSAEPDYLKAIELDAKQAAAYGKLADVYIALGENDKAREILQKGVDATGDTDLQARLDQLSGTSEAADGGTLEISGVSASYQAGGAITKSNPNAVGGMHLSFTVSGPAAVRTVLIASWQPSWTDAEIRKTVERMVGIWKGKVSLDAGQTLPMTAAESHPVESSELGTTQQVLLVGLDADGNAAGYALVTEQIPAQ
jgi:tetratricopeptide (TPR) repeat protein